MRAMHWASTGRFERRDRIICLTVSTGSRPCISPALRTAQTADGQGGQCRGQHGLPALYAACARAYREHWPIIVSSTARSCSGGRDVASARSGPRRLDAVAPDCGKAHGCHARSRAVAEQDGSAAHALLRRGVDARPAGWVDARATGAQSLARYWTGWTQFRFVVGAAPWRACAATVQRKGKKGLVDTRASPTRISMPIWSGMTISAIYAASWKPAKSQYGAAAIFCAIGRDGKRHQAALRLGIARIGGVAGCSAAVDGR